jgi:hypothetical protein
LRKEYKGMTDYKDGDTITVNGKPCRIEDGALVPVVKRGPLGGELAQISDSTLNPGDVVYLKLTYQRHRGELGRLFKDDFGLSCHMDIDGVHFETNIPRPTFTPMTAGEASKMPDIVGRWVAVRVCKKSSDELVLGDEIYERWFDRDDQILLIEGVDL